MVNKRKSQKRRRVGEKARSADRANALIGVRKWKSEPHTRRVNKRMRPSHGWGFNGKSPNTRLRTYKTKRNRGEVKPSS